MEEPTGCIPMPLIIIHISTKLPSAAGTFMKYTSSIIAQVRSSHPDTQVDHQIKVATYFTDGAIQNPMAKPLINRTVFLHSTMYIGLRIHSMTQEN